MAVLCLQRDDTAHVLLMRPQPQPSTIQAMSPATPRRAIPSILDFRHRSASVSPPTTPLPRHAPTGPSAVACFLSVAVVSVIYAPEAKFVLSLVGGHYESHDRDTLLRLPVGVFPNSPSRPEMAIISPALHLLVGRCVGRWHCVIRVRHRHPHFLRPRVSSQS